MQFHLITHIDNLYSVTSQYPELDCVFLNAGTQSRIDLGQPDTVDLDKFHDEINTNFNSLVALSVKFLPFLKNKNSPTSIILYANLFLLLCILSSGRIPGKWIGIREPPLTIMTVPVPTLP